MPDAAPSPAPDSSGRLIEFDVRTPLETAALRAQVQHALMRGLPEVAHQERRSGQVLRLIANGPSALAAPLRGAPTLAVNNALRLFTDRGLAPDYWIACDPQDCVADFVRDAPADTTYLVASKCHPSVFEALAGRKILVWHCGEPDTLDLFMHRLVVPTAVSVTLCALNLMPVLGFDRIECWGWDGCYMQGRDHAVAQAHQAGDVTIRIGARRRFQTTPSWAAEAEDAVHLFQSAPRKVRVRGRGMIGAILRGYRLAR